MPIRSLLCSPFFKLKNLRQGARKFGKESRSAEWEETTTGERPPSLFLVVKSPNKDFRATPEVNFRAAPGEQPGPIPLAVAFGAGSLADLPVEVELYLATRGPQWSDLSFKLSNSVKLGSAEYTYARNWTPQETERIATVIGPPAAVRAGPAGTSSPSVSLAP